jgi:FkbM family methyltransferase
VTFISYAQNFEDVLLHRALSEIENGFYIDIGAGDPVIDSVTKSFYDSGWSGINIEPNIGSYMELARYRSRDLNLMVALGHKTGKIDFWQMNHNALSTASEHLFLKHEMNGFQGKRIEVECRTLSDICAEFAQVADIHFLKVDVEGFEREVLLGANFVDFRPWIVVVEATTPNTQVDVSKEWIQLLTEYKYEIVYKDGLNIYFLAAERKYLTEKFEYPPNVFDQFIKYDHSLNLELSIARQELSKINDELQLILKSNIWVKTRFLRSIKGFFRKKNANPERS